MFEMKLPDPGEGLLEAEITQWLVAPGDTVEVNQVVVEVETAKSLVELPAAVAGVVAVLRCAEGDVVPVGSVFLTIDDGRPGVPGGPVQEGGTQALDAENPSPGREQVERSAEPAASGAVLVGYGTADAPVILWRMLWM